MTNAEFAILNEMASKAGWLRPMDFGGTDASGHSKIAIRMIAKGWVERDRRGQGRAYRYSITDKGRLARNNAAELRALADRI